MLTAVSGEEAIKVYGEQADNIQLIILDIIMPDMNGQETYHRLKKISRKAKVLFASGYSFQNQIEKLVKEEGNYFISKPFDIGELSEQLRTILD